MSCAIIKMRTAFLYDSVSKLPSSFKKRKRFNDAKLHAELSKCMYSLHGFDPLIRPALGTVCHLFIVVSNCIPGSAQFHAASAIKFISSLARTVSKTSPFFTDFKSQVLSSKTAFINSSVARTELFAF